jgi:hypothetical protein
MLRAINQDEGMEGRTAARLAWSLWGIFGLLGATGLIFQRFNGAIRWRDIALGLALASYPTVGVLITSRQPRNAIGWMFCAFGLGLAAHFFLRECAIYAVVTEPGSIPGGALMASVSSWLPIPTYVVGATFFPLLFPDGHVPSPEWRALPWVVGIHLTIVILGAALFPGEVDGFRGVDNPLGVEIVGNMQDLLWFLFVLIFPVAVICWGALMDRFGRSRGVERQQLKWFAFAIGAAIPLMIPAVNDVLGTGWPIFLAFAGLIIPPVAVANAMLKYRLYEIDLIINRTLVYGVLTAVLALVYLGGVVGVGGLVRGITGQERNTLVVAASTLAVAGLFRPARNRIQGFIDRRFYRSKYDAQQTIADFSAKMRDEIDLTSLTSEMAAAVNDTVQPTHVSLWLKS